MQPVMKAITVISGNGVDMNEIDSNSSQIDRG